MNLLQLNEYAEQTNNTVALTIINGYLKTTKESWTKGKYYFGGQIPLDTTEDITGDHLKLVQEKNNSAMAQGACNSWEQMSMSKSVHEFNVIKKTINMRLNSLRLNGLLRVLVFWIVPARKRAAEKVFHPLNMTTFFNEAETDFNKYISHRNDMRNDAISGIL